MFGLHHFGGPHNWKKKFFNAAISGDHRHIGYMMLSQGDAAASNFWEALQGHLDHWVPRSGYPFGGTNCHMVALLWSIAHCFSCVISRQLSLPCSCTKCILSKLLGRWTANSQMNRKWWGKKMHFALPVALLRVTSGSQSLWESLWWGFLG